MSMFPAEVVAAAQAAHAKYFPKGPYASVTLAQWAIESAYGKAEPAGSDNPFGIKAVPGQAYVASRTREVLHGVSVYIEAKFAKYATLEDAFEAHAKLLATSPIYAEAQRATTVETYVRAMAKHYATAPNYADAIIGLIQSANLTQYDLPVSPAPAARPAPPAIASASTSKGNAMPAPTTQQPALLGDFLQFLQDLPFATIGPAIAAGGTNIPFDFAAAEAIAAAAVRDFFHHGGDTANTPNTAQAVANASGAIGG